MTASGMSALPIPVWPKEDFLRLLALLEVREIGAVTSVARSVSDCTKGVRTAKVDSSGVWQSIQLEHTLADLELALSSVKDELEGHSSACASGAPAGQDVWTTASQVLCQLEDELETELRYVYAPDWDVKPAKLVSKKGTWLKKSSRFSWDMPESDKLYLPHGIAMPVMQIGRVTDPAELQLHDWTSQHLRVWLQPSIVRELEARRGTWYVYWPHFQELKTDNGSVIVAVSDTWLKRTTQMSGELQPTELVYMPKGLALELDTEPAVVDEEWEKHRHPYVFQHRKVVTTKPMRTVKQDKYEIFVAQLVPSVEPAQAVPHN
mmetsp:Transcript_6317/g.13821  ORF Transcript_6317/g.13821 Transcript_6317/m.13821 type:complete len:320 (+) Transcript_6317:43-1002(+)